MSGPSVYLTWPTTFKPIPDPLPNALPPPVKERSFRSPFGIDKGFFNFALEPWLPVTFAAVYIVTVFSLNAYNRTRDYKPWWIGRQKPFQYFVVVHNVLLAIFSAATFFAMLRAILHTWPGIRGNSHTAASVADALCKINGPRGLGDAATFNTTINIWEVKNTAIRLGYDGNPDATDVGRLWNEGLAFWGWVFYVSKFYEVLDTLIILAKGKRSATLQTYHHAGAMLCMWAGIRYMSPPIWMFVFINSAIHAMMYTYFTFSALGYKVPQGLKRALTSLQIAQFVFGASYAAAHLFVAYDIPVQAPYQVASVVERAASSVSSAAVAATSTVSSVIASPTSREMGALIKKLLLRAAGEEGLAENVRDKRHHLMPQKMEEKIEQFNEQTFETRWRTDWTKVNCIDTSGEAFAIYLNLLYLAPLTGLFLRFFYKAYTQRGKPKRASQASKQIAGSSKQAEEETEQYIERSGEKVEEKIAKRGPEIGDKIRKEAHDLHEQLRQDVEQMKQGKFKGSRRVSDRVASFEGKVKNAYEKGKEQVGSAVEKAKEQGRQSTNGSGSGSPREERSGSPQKKGESAIEEDELEEQQEGREEEKEKEKGGDEEMRPKRQADEATSQPKQDNGGKEAEGKDDQPAQNKKSEDSNESEEKQDENMADSQAVREGEGDGEVDGKKGSDKKSQSGKSNNSGGAPADEGATNESEEKQDANMEDSQAVRPGADSEEPQSPSDDKSASKPADDEEEDNSDAMGQSGSIIDMAKEKANDAQKDLDRQGDDGKKEEGDATEGAEPSGQQWKRPAGDGS